MVEEVNTGGNVRFVYPKGHKSDPDSDEDYRLSKMVEEGYEKARKRKLKNRILITGAAILALIIVGIYFLLA